MALAGESAIQRPSDGRRILSLPGEPPAGSIHDKLTAGPSRARVRGSRDVNKAKINCSSHVLSASVQTGDEL